MPYHKIFFITFVAEMSAGCTLFLAITVGSTIGGVVVSFLFL